MSHDWPVVVCVVCVAVCERRLSDVVGDATVTDLARQGKAARRKGVTFERRVRRAFEDAGFDVRGLEGGGDHACFGRNGLVVASEAKNQERLKVPEWWRQTVNDAPHGAVPVLSVKIQGGEILAMLRLSDLLRLAR